MPMTEHAPATDDPDAAPAQGFAVRVGALFAETPAGDPPVVYGVVRDIGGSSMELSVGREFAAWALLWRSDETWCVWWNFPTDLYVHDVALTANLTDTGNADRDAVLLPVRRLIPAGHRLMVKVSAPHPATGERDVTAEHRPWPDFDGFVPAVAADDAPPPAVQADAADDDESYADELQPATGLSGVTAFCILACMWASLSSLSMVLVLRVPADQFLVALDGKLGAFLFLTHGTAALTTLAALYAVRTR